MSQEILTNTEGAEAPFVLECPPDLLTAFADNMAVVNLDSKLESEGTRLKGGVDTLHLSLVVDWSPRFYEKTVNLLKSCQDAAKSGTDGGEFFRIGDQVFRVFGNGAGRGKGVFRHFIVDGGGIHFELSRCNAEGRDDYFNAVVVIGSITCNSLDLDTLWRRVVLVIEALGGKIINDTVSRVDPYVDAAGVPISWAFEAWAKDRIVCRAKSFKVFGDRKDAQTLQFGAGTFIRIYNKVAELVAKPDDRKAEQITRKFGGEMPEVLTRFEFQVNRRFLRERQINRFADLRANLNSLGSYLAEQWFRICAGKIDRRATQLALTAETWRAIAEAFGRIGDDAKKNLVRVTNRVRNGKALVRQAVGCLLKAVHGQVISLRGFFLEASESIQRCVSDMGTNEFESRLSQCHAAGLSAVVDAPLSGPPKFVSAEDVFRRLSTLAHKREERQKKASSVLFGQSLLEEYVGESWPETWDGTNEDDDDLQQPF